MGAATTPTSEIPGLVFDSCFFQPSERDRQDKSCSIRCLLFNYIVHLKYLKKGQEKIKRCRRVGRNKTFTPR